MKTYEQVENYMSQVGIKYFKNANEFAASLISNTSRDWAKRVIEELNARATGAYTNSEYFYKLKNETLKGSILVASAFDGGVFRHIGNLIVDNAPAFHGTILDLACDCGLVTCFIAKEYPQCKVVGVDSNDSAINIAKELAQKLGLTNVEFVTANLLEDNLDYSVDTVCSFRTLLDVCEFKTAKLSFFGERDAREEKYKNAFSQYANNISQLLKDSGFVISVERYTADYGWLGWMQALEEQGVYTVSDKCDLMRAADITSVKDYSVTVAQKAEGNSDAKNTYNSVLSRSFKSGMGYDGYMAEFALYTDAESKINFIDIYKDDKLIHQFASASTNKDKTMFYEASGDKKKITYANAKKSEKLKNEVANKLKLYDEKIYKTEVYEI